MGEPIGVTVALGAVGWVNPWGSQGGLWGGCPHWGHRGTGSYRVGAAIGDMVALEAMGWVNPLGTQWGLWGWCPHWGHSRGLWGG